MREAFCERNFVAAVSQCYARQTLFSGMQDMGKRQRVCLFDMCTVLTKMLSVKASKRIQK